VHVRLITLASLSVLTLLGNVSPPRSQVASQYSLQQVYTHAGEGSRQLSASTRQAVLIALSALGEALGSSHPKPFIAVLPAIVAAAKDVHRSVRSSALAAAASCLAALASAALPLLPRMVPAVLAAAQTAVDGLAMSPAAHAMVGFPCFL